MKTETRRGLRTPYGGSRGGHRVVGDTEGPLRKRTRKEHSLGGQGSGVYQ